MGEHAQRNRIFIPQTLDEADQPLPLLDHRAIEASFDILR